MAAADAMRERLFDAIDPTPRGVLDADGDVLRDAGLSAAKVEYARALAAAWRENDWSRQYFASMTDDAVLDELTEVRGVGPWTGKMFPFLLSS